MPVRVPVNRTGPSPAVPTTSCWHRPSTHPQCCISQSNSKWVRKLQFLASGVSHSHRKGYAIKNLTGSWHTEAVGHRLSVGREVRTEIPAKGISMKGVGVVVQANQGR